jgi:hypothetical protein
VVDETSDEDIDRDATEAAAAATNKQTSVEGEMPQ